MKNDRLLTIVLVLVLLIQATLSFNLIGSTYAQTNPNVYVGVDIAFGATADAKSIIDKVSSYTNLVVFGSTQVTWFPDRVNETFQYAFDKGLSIISLKPSVFPNSPTALNETEWYQWAKDTWGDKVLGFYILDEPGGRTLDGNFSYAWNQYVGYPNTYSEAATKFEDTVSGWIDNEMVSPLFSKAFTSDYALYWFDYKAGYSAVFAEIGGNSSKQINISLARGAATAQNKDWGAIITWKYTDSPWIESPDQLYDDMVLAYDNGAKYIIVFDSNEQGGSILTSEHLQAMQRFWNYAQNNQPKTNAANQRTAYVLPDAYGFGFRWPTDHIWGLWQADELSTNITRSVGTLLTQYGDKLDIIYNDNLQGNNGYNQVIYWNNFDPTPTASPSPPPTPTPTPSPSPSPPPNNDLQEHLPLIIAATVASAAIVTAYYLLLLKRNQRKNTT